MTKVTKKETTAVTEAIDYGQYAGTGDTPAAGMEHMTPDDMIVSFVTILQDLSPQVKPTHKGGVEGAEVGMICNTATQEIASGSDGVAFIPCWKEHTFAEWVPRNKGGDFVGLHEPLSEVVRIAKEESKEFSKLYVGSNELHETFNIYGLCKFGEGAYSPAVLRFKSMSIKKYRMWMTMANNVSINLPDGSVVKPPLFAQVYRLTSIEQTKGNDDFYNWNIAFDGGDATSSRLKPSSTEFKLAAQFYEAMKQGNVKVSDDNISAEIIDDADEAVPF